jgi:hypothetical protein
MPGDESLAALQLFQRLADSNRYRTERLTMVRDATLGEPISTPSGAAIPLTSPGVESDATTAYGLEDGHVVVYDVEPAAAGAEPALKARPMWPTLGTE